MSTTIKSVSFLFLLFADLDNVEGIAVDWIGNNLYWTNDGHRKTINVARLEKASQSRKTLLEGEMSHPRGIVVDPVSGYEMFDQLYIKKMMLDNLVFAYLEEVHFIPHVHSHINDLIRESYSFNDFLS